MEMYTVKNELGEVLIVSENWEEIESVLSVSAFYTYYTEEN